MHALMTYIRGTESGSRLYNSGGDHAITKGVETVEEYNAPLRQTVLSMSRKVVAAALYSIPSKFQGVVVLKVVPLVSVMLRPFPPRLTKTEECPYCSRSLESFVSL